jgi:hypothetical protein
MSQSEKHTLRNVLVAIFVTVIGGLAVYAIQKYLDRKPVYKLAETEDCGVLSYKSNTGEVCGVVYNSKRDQLCGIEQYNLGQDKECGVDTDQNHWVPLKTLGYRSGHKTNYCLDHGCNVPRYSRLIIPTYFGWDKHKNPAVRKAGCFPHAMRYERC